MLGDVLLITEKHINAAQEIVKEVLAKKKDRFIIAISGESGSGKSELAHSVAKELKHHKITAKPLHIDNYYRILPLERTQWRKDNGIETAVGLGEYDWDTLYRNVGEFKSGSKSTGPCVDLVTEQVDQLTTDYSEVDMLIIDGLYAVETKGVDLAVFIELTYHETKKAQVIRGKEPQNEYRARVLEREHQVVQSLKPKAHLLVNMQYQVMKA